MGRILLVEDDNGLALMVRDWLGFENHVVDHVVDGDEALRSLKTTEYDVVILDLELPDIHGIDILKSFRASGGNTPILILTGKKAINDKLPAFDAGADDYLTKPFHMKELSARVRVLLRRPGPYQPSTKLTIRNIELDPHSHRAWKNGEEIHLQRKEFAVLEFLMRHPNQVFSAEALLGQLWEPTSDASPDTVRTCLKKLRKKIDDSDEGSLIKNVHGVGYRLETN